MKWHLLESIRCQKKPCVDSISRQQIHTATYINSYCVIRQRTIKTTRWNTTKSTVEIKQCKHTYSIDRRRIEALHSHLTKNAICNFGPRKKKNTNIPQFGWKWKPEKYSERKNSCCNPRMAIWIERVCEKSPAERTKNGGPPWLPVQGRENNDWPLYARTTRFSTKQSHKIYALTSI